MIAIAALSRNGAIGKDGRIPWHLPGDLKFFKATTTGHVILMGRKTFDSLGRPLPNREHWVLTRGADIPGVRTIRDLSEIQEPTDGRKLFVIGGAEIYAALLPACDELYLTHVPLEAEGDAFFPPYEHLFDAGEVIQETPEMTICHYRRLVSLASGGS